MASRYPVWTGWSGARRTATTWTTSERPQRCPEDRERTKSRDEGGGGAGPDRTLRGLWCKHLKGRRLAAGEGPASRPPQRGSLHPFFTAQRRERGGDNRPVFLWSPGWRDVSRGAVTGTTGEPSSAETSSGSRRIMGWRDGLCCCHLFVFGGGGSGCSFSAFCFIGVKRFCFQAGASRPPQVWLPPPPSGWPWLLTPVVRATGPWRDRWRGVSKASVSCPRA